MQCFGCYPGAPNTEHRFDGITNLLAGIFSMCAPSPFLHAYPMLLPKLQALAQLPAVDQALRLLVNAVQPAPGG